MAASQPPGDRRIVVGVDGSPPSREALRWAVRQAALTGSVVDAVIAWHDPANHAGYAWLIADTCDRDLAAKTLSDVVDSAIPAGSAVTVRQRVIDGHAPACCSTRHMAPTCSSWAAVGTAGSPGRCLNRSASTALSIHPAPR